MAEPLRKRAPESAQVQDEPAAKTLAVSHAAPEASALAAMPRMSAETGKSPMALMRDYAALAFGPGKVSLPDYVRLRLFDESFWAGQDRRAVVGQRRNRDLVVEANWRHDWYGMTSNKIASSQYLAAFGLPTIPLRAIYAPNMQRESWLVIRDAEALQHFLLDPENYPLFGKPAEGNQSLGSVGLTRCEPDTGMLIRTDGSKISVTDLIADINNHYADNGYVLQPLMAPHDDIIKLAGRKLATSRIVTIATEDGPKIFRASWKVPVGSNVADNYWRSGNLLAGLDLATGKVLRATSSTGFDLVNVTHHPDTGEHLIGAAIPNFAQMKEIALEGARLMRHFSVIGWDMASTPAGPMIVEMNETPDLFLNQLADRFGVLDADWTAFMRFQKTRSEAFVKKMKADIAAL